MSYALTPGERYILSVLATDPTMRVRSFHHRGRSGPWLCGPAVPA